MSAHTIEDGRARAYYCPLAAGAPRGPRASRAPRHLGAESPPDNGMHPTANTTALKFLQWLEAAGDAGREAAQVSGRS